MRKIYTVLLSILAGFTGMAQVTTNGGSGLALNYATLNQAIAALNGATINSPVTITLTANETAPVGGYSISAQGSAVNTISLIGGGKTVTAHGALVAGSLSDAIFRLCMVALLWQ